jgi:hypothetical protein
LNLRPEEEGHAGRRQHGQTEHENDTLHNRLRKDPQTIIIALRTGLARPVAAIRRREVEGPTEGKSASRNIE